MPSMNAVLRTRCEELKSLVIADSRDLEGWTCENALYLDFGKYEYLNNKRTVNIGDVWAKAGQTAFFEKDVTIPPEWEGAYVAFEFLAAGEGLLYVNSKPFSGIDDNRGYVRIAQSAAAGEEYSLKIEMKTGGYHEYLPRDTRMPFILRSSRLCVIDKALEAAYFDFLVPFEVASSLQDTLLQNAVYGILHDCFLMADFTRKADREYMRQALGEASAELKRRLAALELHKETGEALYTGHSHIDVAWLWPLKESMRKVGRTYSTVASLMDEYPEYYFNCSQVPLYQYLKKNFPSVYKEIKARAAEGRFEPIGGTWVENDTNLLAGESLVRQCLYGQRFFMKEFGKKVRVGWLPDVFGYSYSLPQIYKKSGIDYFMTTKLTWNDTNRFPWKAFKWEGIDGSQLKCFLSNTYVDNINFPGHYNVVVKDYPDKLTLPDYLAVFGFGDGGGGPTRYNLEKIRRLADAPGFPRARTGTVESFFENSVEKASDKLPVWNGELYFEYHRGTYTSQANNKKNNRKCEIALRNAEIMCCLAKEFGFQYPKKAITDMWETVLLNHFHDIIPGSSINEVYRVSGEQYASVLKQADKIIRKAARFIADSINTGANQFVVFNTLSHVRTDIIEVKGAPFGMTAYDDTGKALPCQYESDTLVIEVPEVPPMGYRLITLKKEKAPHKHEFGFDGRRLSCPRYDILFNSDGTIQSLWDFYSERDVLVEDARGNLLQVFEDKPTAYDAWELEPSYKERADEFKLVSGPSLVFAGPVRCVLRSKYAYGKSEICQDILVYANKDSIDFRTRVDWHEKNTLLKTSFPVDIRSNRASYEIAYGIIERSTNNNTTWEQAQYEVSGHRFADLSETGYGVSILNDCKYGWDIKGNLMRLSLLRSPSSPDPEADQGEHCFTYSLFPHFDNCLYDTVDLAHELNNPLIFEGGVVEGEEAKAEVCLAEVLTENAVIDCIKEAEDDPEAFIFRLYEPYGARGAVEVVFYRPIVSICETDLLEESIGGVTLEDDDTLVFDINPFEIRTFKVVFE